MRHLAARPAVSATYLPGEELAVTVHGRAELFEMRDPACAELRQAMLDWYVPRQGPEFETWLDALDAVAARIAAGEDVHLQPWKARFSPVPCRRLGRHMDDELARGRRRSSGPRAERGGHRQQRRDSELTVQPGTLDVTVDVRAPARRAAPGGFFLLARSAR